MVEKIFDSKQELSELITLSALLSDRADRLTRKANNGEATLAEINELSRLREATLEAPKKMASDASSSEYVHQTEAGRKLKNRMRYGQPLTMADLAQIKAMREFPEFKSPDFAARRMCYLMAICDLGLASSQEKSEFQIGSHMGAVANA